MLRLDKKASAESFAARRPGAGGRGIDEPFLNKDQKAQSRLETKAAFGGGEGVAFLSSIDPLCMSLMTAR